MLELAETYMDRDDSVSISVTGGGSGMGIAALINGKTDIANSSRSLKSEELTLAVDRGIDPQGIIFAVDALAIVVHAQNPVDSIHLEDLGKVFSGELSNWEPLGGKQRDISLYGRQSNSGTFVYFRDEIVRAEYANTLKQMNGTSQIIESIKQDVAGIGYVGIGYVIDRAGSPMEGIKVLKISQRPGSVAVDPTVEENIIGGVYPIMRPLFQYVDGQPSQALRDFIAFELGETGQDIVRRNGYFPITDTHRAHNRALGIP